MKNRPQMLKDLADMSARLNAANARIKELEARPDTVREIVRVEVPVVKYQRDLNKERSLQAEIDRLNSELSKKPKTVIVKEKPEVVTNATQKTVVEYYKCPQQSAIIADLRAKLANG